MEPCYVKPGEWIEFGGMFRVTAEVAGDRIKLTPEVIIKRETSRPRTGPLAAKVKEQQS